MGRLKIESKAIAHSPSFRDASFGAGPEIYTLCRGYGFFDVQLHIVAHAKMRVPE